MHWGTKFIIIFIPATHESLKDNIKSIRSAPDDDTSLNGDVLYVIHHFLVHCNTGWSLWQDWHTCKNLQFRKLQPLRGLYFQHTTWAESGASEGYLRALIGKVSTTSPSYSPHWMDGCWFFMVLNWRSYSTAPLPDSFSFWTFCMCLIKPCVSSLPIKEYLCLFVP